MKKLIKQIFIFSLLSITLLACMQSTETDSSIDNIINEMSLEQKITQMLMLDFRQWKTEGEEDISDMTVLNDEIATIIDQYDLGGVILFANNVIGTEQTAKLTTDLQQAAISNLAGNGKIPLLIGIDQEGGTVARLGSGTALPGNMAIGATKSQEIAKQAGQIIGSELSVLGINVNFAPIMDVNNNPNNPVIGLRSFSSDPNLVAQLGIPMIQGMQDYNIATAAKHFPGHGDTNTDSHTGLPLINKTYEEMTNFELIPFQAAIDHGVDMLMTAHIQFPNIEQQTATSKLDGSTIHIPAILSPVLMTDILRHNMNYEGVIITDAMNMDAISLHFGEAEAILMAIQAGIDICLMPTILHSTEDVTKLDAIIDHIKDAVNSGALLEETLDSSVRRILELKETRDILSYSSTAPSWDQKLAEAQAVVGSEENRQREREISQQAVTIIKNDDNILPLNPKANEKVLLIGADDRQLPGMELGMKRLISENVISDQVQYESLIYSSSTTNEELHEQITNSNYVIVISAITLTSQLSQDHWLTAKPTAVISYANSKNIPVVVMSISKPYDVANYPNAKSIITVYGDRGMDPTEGLQPEFIFGPNIPAGIETIFNSTEIKGTLPVDIPTIVDGVIDVSQIQYPIGHGITY